ncbi:MAG: tetratricopeptide repeat protein [Alphaproteobacteria bacterium]|nr:tetratricopeptide repeat protein [Alphaproteobacteria bacterium]
MNRQQRRAAASRKKSVAEIDLGESDFHARIERSAPTATLTLGLGDGMGPGAGWSSGIMEAGVTRKKFSLFFRLLVRLLLRPWLLARIHQPEALWFLGVMAQRVGKEQLGKHLIARATGLDPELARRKPLVEKPVGRTLAQWRALTENTADSAAAWMGLGEALHARGDDEDAMAAFSKALALDAGLEEAYSNLGAILLRQSRFSEAEEVFLRHCKAHPKSARAFNNLGNAMMRQGRAVDAERTLRKAAALGPDLVEPHNNLGNALSLLGRVDEAVVSYQRARKLKPDSPEVLLNLGTAFLARGDFKSAADCYFEVIEIKPDLGEAYLNLGILLQNKSKFTESEAAFRHGIEILPKLPVLHAALGNLLQNMGRVEEAKDCYQRGLAIKEDAGYRVEMALLCPVVYDTMEQASEWRQHQVEAIQALEAANAEIKDPYSSVNLTNFYQAYPGLDDRPLQETLGRFFTKACQELTWTAPHLAAGKWPQPRKRIRLGVLSAFLEPTHTIGKLFAGLLANLPRSRFELVIFRFYHQSPNLTREIDEKADRVVRLPLRPGEQLQRIAAERLDILFFPDIGMSYHTYFMAFSRLAPVQVVAWGHPDTTGIPNMDYFVSTDYLDPPGNESHYTEKLARLPLPPCCYQHPKLAQDELADRKALKLPEDKRLYVCAQTPFKVHPEFRQALKRILERDTDGIVVFINANPFLTKRLSQNLERELGGLFKRVHFVDPLKYQEFLGLCATADALLDTFHFSGGNSSLEAFAYGSPIVTLPSAFMRGRVTAQFYKMMGIDDLIAADADHYVELALKLAKDRDWRAQMRERILAAKGVLFENKDAVAHFADFLEKAALGEWRG